MALNAAIEREALIVRLDALFVCEQARLLTEALFGFLDSSPEASYPALHRALRLMEKGAAFDFDVMPAAGAGEHRIVLKPRKAFLEAVAASGTSDRQLDAINRAFSHGCDPSASCASAETARLQI